ncbi:MAG: MATE family efflux transporter [Lachnospiraceae bacterium]|nr:MATE family efflux transporter [Lachnospiraceae bacterium]
MAGIILSLAWPTMLEQLMQTTVQYIDTAMVGTLGTGATAAVGSTGTINWLVSGSIGALSIGFLSYIAKACGAKDLRNAKRAAAQAVLMVLVVGSFFTLLTVGLSSQIPVWMQVEQEIQELAGRYFLILYAPMLFRTASIIFGNVLRAVGDTKTPMKIGVIVNIVNVILNFLFIYPVRKVEIWGKTVTIYGTGWGVLGAAAASATAFCIGGIIISIVLFRHPMISPKGHSIKPQWDILQPCLKVAIPNMLQRFGTSLGYVFFAAMINSVGEVATAAHTIANTVESLFYIPAFGMQTAAATLAGNAYGAKDGKRMKALSHMFIPIEVTLMFITGSALFAVAPIFMGVFSQNEAVITLGATVLRMVAVSEPFYGFSIIVEGFMQGVGKTKEPFVYNIIGMWGIRIVGTFVCTQLLGLGLVSAWACMISHNLLLFMLFLIAYVKDSWNPLSVVRDRV